MEKNIFAIEVICNKWSRMKESSRGQLCSINLRMYNGALQAV